LDAWESDSPRRSRHRWKDATAGIT